MSGLQELYRLADVVAGKPSAMMLFPLGNWTSAKYPKLSLKQELADEVIANFESEVLRTKVPVEMTGIHSQALAPAAGWIERVYMAPFEWGGVSGEALYADWTPNELGAQAVNDGQYAYDSVEFDKHIDPVTKAETPNVLKAVALTNRPVLRMMPSVRDAGDSIKLAEALQVELSELSLADVDPMSTLLDDIEAVIGRANEELRGKPGVRAIRTYLHEVRAKAGAHVAAAEDEDDGSPVEDTQASSDDVSQSAKVDEGPPVTLAEGDAAKEGSETVDPKITKALQLTEDADEAAVEAAVLKLTEDRDAEKTRAETAEAKLAETEKAKRDGEVEAKLAELIEGGHVAPGQKETWLKLAEDAPGAFDEMAESQKTVKAIDLDEHGTHEGAADENADPSADISRRAIALSEEKGIDISDAYAQAIADTPGLAERRLAELAERIQAS